MVMDKLKTNKKCTWYALKVIENGWSRNIIAMQIEFLSKRNS